VVISKTINIKNMKRRKFIKTVGSIAGTVAIGGQILFIPSCTNEIEPYNSIFNIEDIRFFNELAETIIPTTTSPGGKAAKVGDYMALVIRDCFPEEEQVKYKEAIIEVNSKSKEVYNRTFLQCSEEQRSTVAGAMNEEGNEYFKLLKELIVEGYMTSEIGRTQFLEYYPVPGRYDECTTKRPW
jgi:hypothetical protein